MEGVSYWLQQIFDIIISFFPHRRIVPPTDVLLKYKWHGGVVCKKPGFRIYWPLFTSVEQITVVRQSLDDMLPIKFMTDKNIPCIADASCIYSVCDPIKYATENYDITDTIRESLSASICGLLTNRSLDSIKNIEQVNIDLTNEIDVDLENFGIELEQVRLNNLSWIIPIYDK